MKTKHEISLTAEQVGEVLAPIVGVVLNMKPERAQYWIGRKKKLASEIGKVLIGENPYTDLIVDWQNFWRELDGLDSKEHNFSDIHIPEKPGEGNRRLLIMDDIAL